MLIFMTRDGKWIQKPEFGNFLNFKVSKSYENLENQEKIVEIYIKN